MTNSDSAGDKLVLLPPHGEIPPAFWEQHGALVSALALLAVMLALVVLWWRLRPRPKKVLPPAELARQELRPLQNLPEDGDCLTKISRVLRNYFVAAFNLPAGEITTTEFCRLISTDEKIGAELSADVAGFLRRCDERKFSPANAAVPASGAANQALDFVVRGERRRENFLKHAESGNQIAAVSKS